MLSRKCKRFIYGITLCSSLFLSNANAGPDSTTSHFMNSSATMFDIGLLRVDRLIRTYQYASYFAEGMALQAPSYNWDDDIIKIEVIFNNFNKVPDPVVTEYCKQAIEGLQALGGVSETGAYLYSNRSQYADAFSHNGFAVAGENELLLELDKKFTISCMVFAENRMQEQYTKKLLGRSISKIQF